MPATHIIIYTAPVQFYLICVRQKFFAMEEAQKIAVSVAETMKDVFVLNEKIDAVAKDIDNLIDIWGEELFSHKHPDNGFYQENMRIRNETIMKLKMKMDEIQDTGCIVKSIEEGIIDFPSKIGERLIHLCWKYGESGIKYWHATDEDDSKRRPLEAVVA